MFILSELFFGKLQQGNLLLEVNYYLKIIFLYLKIIYLYIILLILLLFKIDISGSNLAKEVIANNLRPTIPDRVPKNLTKLI